MPCFSCKNFNDGRGRNGERLPGGKGYCKLWDEEYWRGHECGDYCPAWLGGSSGSDGCFLTTACVDYFGKTDDCEELTILRRFRDEVLKETEKGIQLINDYYTIAPKLVKMINASDEKAFIYQSIYECICKCIEAIKQRENEKAVDIYREMVRTVFERVSKTPPF